MVGELVRKQKLNQFDSCLDTRRKIPKHVFFLVVFQLLIT
jgi:hypothetical protein